MVLSPLDPPNASIVMFLENKFDPFIPEKCYNIFGDSLLLSDKVPALMWQTDKGTTVWPLIISPVSSTCSLTLKTPQHPILCHKAVSSLPGRPFPPCLPGQLLVIFYNSLQANVSSSATFISASFVLSLFLIGISMRNYIIHIYMNVFIYFLPTFWV